jgi:hypothetical protein
MIGPWERVKHYKPQYPPHFSAMLKAIDDNVLTHNMLWDLVDHFQLKDGNEIVLREEEYSPHRLGIVIIRKLPRSFPGPYTYVVLKTALEKRQRTLERRRQAAAERKRRKQQALDEYRRKQTEDPLHIGPCISTDEFEEMTQMEEEANVAYEDTDSSSYDNDSEFFQLRKK